MTKQDLAETAAKLMDDIATDPVNWRAFEDRLRQVIAGFDQMGEKLPGQLQVYADWLEEDEIEDRFENLPV